MQVVYERCCGLDVHKRTVVACRIVPESRGQWRREIRTFGTMTQNLLALVDWLQEAGVTHVAMESTGVYWWPIYNLLEAQFTVLVVNARHLKAVPGRKTDVKDAEWIAELLQHGLVRSSFIPDQPQRELRELTRYRATLVQERARVVQRLQKVLEETNLKVGSVITDITGVSGRAILGALVAGQTDPASLAQLAKGRLRKKLPELEQSLEGIVQSHHRFLLVEQRLCPFEAQVQGLDTIPGVNERIAQVLLAEVGTDLSRFPSAHHLASWAGICPGNQESGGKRQSGKTRKGSPWLRAALIEAAHGAAKSKGTYLSAQFRRLVSRRGKKKALVAVAHSILVIAYHILTGRRIYQELGGNYFDERERMAVERRLTRRLGRLGYQVTLEPISAIP
jgi:transposase